MYSESAVYSDRELRKLKPAELYKLAQILCIQDSWKKLMAIIPKDDNTDLPKFNIEHIRYTVFQIFKFCTLRSSVHVTVKK